MIADSIFADPLAIRGIERLCIIIASTIFGFFGYRLFIFGATRGKTEISAESKLFRLVFSGTAPGLFFMFVAGAILVTAILKGGVNQKEATVEEVSEELRRFIIMQTAVQTKLETLDTSETERQLKPTLELERMRRAEAEALIEVLQGELRGLKGDSKKTKSSSD